MYSRKDIIKEFNITFNGLKRIEKELCLHDPNNRKNKKYSYEDYLRIKETIESKYTLPCDCIRIKNSLLNEYGSIREASRECNIPLSTIFNQCKNETYPRKYNFYFRYNNK